MIAIDIVVLLAIFISAGLIGSKVSFRIGKAAGKRAEEKEKNAWEKGYLAAKQEKEKAKHEANNIDDIFKEEE